MNLSACFLNLVSWSLGLRCHVCRRLLAGGNLMFAADCPMKRAALMTGMTLGRWSHVPAFEHSNRLSWEPAWRLIYLSMRSTYLVKDNTFISILGSGCCFKGFTSQRITELIPVLPSVLSMGAPTWCHVPNWGHLLGRMLTDSTSELTLL